MKTTCKPIEELAQQAETNLCRIIDAVMERGWDEEPMDSDNYSVLIEQAEFRKLVTLELYEAYFPPKRHEFELQIIKDIVDTVAQSKAASYMADALVAGVIGNAAYDMVKRLLAYVINRFKGDKGRGAPFDEVLRNIDAINKFFANRKQATIPEVVSSLDIEPDKVLALLKLLGFTCKRKKKRQVWVKPSHQTARDT